MKKFIRANNRPAPRRRVIKASELGVDGYAVQVLDSDTGYTHLLVYDTEEEAMNTYDDLYLVRWGDVDSDDEYYRRIEHAVNNAKDIINEIDWRKNIYENNVYRYYGDDAIQIVNVNNVSIPLYLNW